MFEMVNRHALIIKPKQPLLDWVNYIFPDSPLTFENIGKHDQANVYLIPATDCPEDSIEYLQQCFELYMEEELFGWCQREELWPQKRDWELFEEWFDYEVHTMVIDMDDRPLVKVEM